MKKILVLCLMFLGSAGIANAACTAEEAQAKVQAFQQAAVAYAQGNTKKYNETMVAMQKDMIELPKEKAKNMDICKFYDEWTKKLK